MSKVFPNNALSLVPANAKFSGITDNALAGEVEVGGQSVQIGGNEDFLYGLKQILFANKDCVLLIDPYVEGERKGEVKGVDSKYIRRQEVYRLYAQRLIGHASRLEQITAGISPEEMTLEQVKEKVKDVVDEHLFFARVDQNSQLEIVLTKRQKTKSITAPI